MLSRIRALTIQQPYAHLIALADDDDEAKRVENRTWGTDYRGPLAIHAGKGRDYLEDGDPERWPDMAFGAVVAVAQLAGCVRLENTSASGLYGSVPDWAKSRWPWLSGHQHVEGPVCWVLTEVRRLAKPVACAGQRNLWDVPENIRLAIAAQLQ